jgi:hypothetical protein
VLPLRLAYEGHEQVRVIASCSTASEVLAVLEREHADGAILDEDLHGLDRLRLAALKDHRCRLVLLSRQPASPRWEGLPGAVLAPETDPIDILRALQHAAPARPTRRRRGNPAVEHRAPPQQSFAGWRARSHQRAGRVAVEMAGDRVVERAVQRG